MSIDGSRVHFYFQHPSLDSYRIEMDKVSSAVSFIAWENFNEFPNSHRITGLINGH
jgi:hypothetical protein